MELSETNETSTLLGFAYGDLRLTNNASMNHKPVKILQNDYNIRVQHEILL